jgi:hypothetical protein
MRSHDMANLLEALITASPEARGILPPDLVAMLDERSNRRPKGCNLTPPRSFETVVEMAAGGFVELAKTATLMQRCASCSRLAPRSSRPSPKPWNGFGRSRGCPARASTRHATASRLRACAWPTPRGCSPSSSSTTARWVVQSWWQWPRTRAGETPLSTLLGR